jgi:opacity protein-like surface antigen
MRKGFVTVLLLGAFCAAADAAMLQDESGITVHESPAKNGDALLLQKHELELQKKELEIERLKLELEKRELAQQRRAQQPLPAPAAQPRTPSGSFYLEYGLGLGGKAKDSWEFAVSDTAIKESGSETSDYTAGHLKLGFGAYDKNRHELFVKSVIVKGKDGSDDLTLSSLGYDYVIVLESMKSRKLLPFIRLGFESGWRKWSDGEKALFAENGIDSGEDRYNFFGLRAGVGVTQRLGEKWELNLAYDYAAYTWEEITLADFPAYGYDTTINAETVLTHFYAGFAYRF